jgi:hypothetical protein
MSEAVGSLTITKRPSGANDKTHSSHASLSTLLKCECSSRGRVDCQAYVLLTCLIKLSDMVQTKPRGFLATGAQIVQRETPLALYKVRPASLLGT